MGFRVARTALLAVVTLLASAPGGYAATGDMNGIYDFAGGAQERRARKAAIERSVQEFFFAWRGVARSRLSKGTSIPKRVEVSRTGNRVVVSFDSRSYALELGAKPVTVRGRGGKKIKAQATMRGGALIIKFTTSQGGQVDTLVKRPSGQLTMDVHVWGKRLDKPVRYRLTYRARS